MTPVKILVVDDEASIRQSYHTILCSENSTKTLDELASSLFDMEDSPLSEEALFFDSSTSPQEPELEEVLFELTDAGQGMEAVERVESALQERVPFSIIFLDMRMPPGINGLETAKRIRALDPLVEIVIVTAYSDYTFEEIAEEVGNPDRLLYFHKPFQPQQIKNLAISLSQRWSLEQKMS